MRNVDPLEFMHLIWPSVYLYDLQREAVKSVFDNDETAIVAANMVGVRPLS